MTKKVLIVEDEEPQRRALSYRLKESGFEVYSTGCVAEARSLAEEHWDELDVIVLDMDLRDPDEPNTTGAEIGIKLRRARWPNPSPEFIISSQIENKLDYYRLAVELRAAAYLEKSKYFAPDVARHVKALALSHALSIEHPAMANRIEQIAAHSDTDSKAIREFCQRILKPELEDCLHTPFIILFSDKEQTYNCAESDELPEECDSLYPLIQDYVYGRKNLTEPFSFKADQLKRQLDPETAWRAEKLDMAAFVPLSVAHDFRLSIGILQEKESEETLELEDAKALGTVLAEYLRPTALESILKLLPRWAALKATLSNTAQLCLVVGQELKYLLPVPDRSEFSWPEDSLRQLWDLADDLNDTGQLLRELDSKQWEGKREPVSIREIASMSWRLITRAEENSERGFKIEGDCTVVADRRDLEIAVSRLLHWLAQRRTATPVNEESLITIKCRDDAAGQTIIFEDKSQRLSKQLRNKLFTTFSQAVPVPFTSESTGRYLPLYLAKMLVEGRYHGALEDHSDDEDIQDRNYGHRIVMQFPPNEQSI